MHCMLMDLLHGFEVLSTTEESLYEKTQIGQKKRFLIFSNRQWGGFDPRNLPPVRTPLSPGMCC